MPVVVFGDRRRFGAGKHYNTKGFVEQEAEQNCRNQEGTGAFKIGAPPCVREWGGDVAQHTCCVVERNVCENMGAFWKAGVDKFPSLSGGGLFFIQASKLRCPKTRFWTQKLEKRPQSEHNSIYVYIYIYICVHFFARELVGCPPFSCWKASWLSTFSSILAPHV